MLIESLAEALREACDNTFAQARTSERAQELAMGSLLSLGRRRISRAICDAGRAQQDWSADYKLFSRSPWNPKDLFDVVLADYVDRHREGPITLILDDTRLKKTGKHIKTASFGRDPMSPPFHANLQFGLRFVQVAAAYPHYRQFDTGPRGLPVRFVECPVVRKPGKRASQEERDAYKKARLTRNLPAQALTILRELRAAADRMGAAGRRILVSVDGGYCNRTIFRADLDRTDLAARCRKDAKLCRAAAPGSKRIYSEETFTPELVRQDESIPWRSARVYYAGQWRNIDYKDVGPVLWQRGAGRRPLRLLVVRAQPHRPSPNGRTYYRSPAYLLTTDLGASAAAILQAYFDRWQIEVNHRDEKDLLGVGQAQVWSARSVPRQPAFVVAAYSLLLLAALRAFGPTRTAAFPNLPKWRKNGRRPSLLDLLTLLRQEIRQRLTAQGNEAPTGAPANAAQGGLMTDTRAVVANETRGVHEMEQQTGRNAVSGGSEPVRRSPKDDHHRGATQTCRHDMVAYAYT